MKKKRSVGRPKGSRNKKSLSLDNQIKVTVRHETDDDRSEKVSEKKNCPNSTTPLDFS